MTRLQCTLIPDRQTDRHTDRRTDRQRDGERLSDTMVTQWYTDEHTHMQVFQADVKVNN